MRRLSILAWVLAASTTVAAAGAEPVRLVVLRDTGRQREGFPVLEADRRSSAIVAGLSRGLSGRLLRLYGAQQRRLRAEGGPAPEPAYLLLSDRRGGFPRFGFFLGGEDKRHAGYVDLHRSSSLSGRFGAMDQIFPHELAHVLVHQLAGSPAEGGSNQIHAIGVRTDPVLAFQEGFAEHFQVLAVDDPDADPSTRRLATDGNERAWIERRLRGYERELEASWAPATRHRMTFPLWFGRVEQGLRYHAVHAHAFAGRSLRAEALAAPDPWRAWLLDSVVPAGTSAPPRGTARMLSVEGVVSHLFLRWVTDPVLRDAYLPDGWYASWGLERDRVDPTDNAYLKIFHAMRVHRPRDTRALIAGYRESFPSDAPRLDALVREVLAGDPGSGSAELWLANADFLLGTSVYDQFRGAPRIHTFDLNAASVIDLLAVPGVDRELAGRIVHAAPYADLSGLSRVPGLPADVQTRFETMRLEMERLRSGGDAGADPETQSLVQTVLRPYLLRAAAFLTLVAVLAFLAFRLVGGSGGMASSAAALGVSILGLPSAWLVEAPGGLAALVVPAVVLGVPATLWRLYRTRSGRETWRAATAWVLASLPGALLATPLF